MAQNSNFVIQKMAEKMLLNFEKYWDVMHVVVEVFTVLDHRYKLEVLEFYFDKNIGARALMKLKVFLIFFIY